MSKELVHSVIQRIAVGPNRGRDISMSEAEQLMQAILAQQVDPVQTAVILIALRMKRESLDEFCGLFSAMRDEFETVVAPVDELVCLADPFDGYQRSLPMTPFLPAVLSACELPACLTGVESVGPKFGVTAQQVLALAGIPTDLSATQAAKCVAEDGWAYVDQQSYAPRLFSLRELRGRIVKRTAVTTLERLLNPLRGRKKTHMVLGFVHREYPEIYAVVAEHAGFSTALLAKGVEGGLAPAINKPLRQHFVDFDQDDPKLVLTKTALPPPILNESAACMTVRGEVATAHETLEIGMKVLNGEHNSARSSLVLAAASIVKVHQSMHSFEQAVEKVQHCLDNGSALARFGALRGAP